MLGDNFEQPHERRPVNQFRDIPWNQQRPQRTRAPPNNRTQNQRVNRNRNDPFATILNSMLLLGRVVNEQQRTGKIKYLNII